MPIAIIVHGGAGKISADRFDPAQAGCKEATLAGWRILQDGGSALEAVETAVRSLEDNPNFNAATGASLTTEGNIELATMNFSLVNPPVRTFVPIYDRRS